MSEAATTQPTNGASSSQQPPAPVVPVKPNGNGKPSNSFTGTPSSSSAPEQGSPSVARGPDGKFVGKNGTEAPSTTETTSTPPPKYKVGDREYTERELHAQLERAKENARMVTESQKRLSAADEKEKRLTERLSALAKGDPAAFRALLDEANVPPDVRKTAYGKLLWEDHLQYEQMTEEQRRLVEAEKRIAAFEAKEKAAEEARQKAENEKLVAEQEQQVSSEIMEAAKAGKIPASKEIVYLIAQKLMDLEKKGHPVSLEHAASIVNREIGERTGWLMDSTSIEQRLDIWGKERFSREAEKWRRYFLSQVRRPAQATAPRTVEPINQARRKTITPTQFLEEFRGIQKGK